MSFKTNLTTYANHSSTLNTITSHSLGNIQDKNALISVFHNRSYRLVIAYCDIHNISKRKSSLRGNEVRAS